MPALAFSEDLIAAYPDAKVVLMERDIESWFTIFDEKLTIIEGRGVRNLLKRILLYSGPLILAVLVAIKYL